MPDENADPELPTLPVKPPTVTGVDTTSPIRRFTNSGIQEKVNAALATLEPGKSMAVVAFADDQAMKLATLARLGTDWTVVMVGERQWSGDFSGEAIVRWSK